MSKILIVCQYSQCKFAWKIPLGEKVRETCPACKGMDLKVDLVDDDELEKIDNSPFLDAT